MPSGLDPLGLDDIRIMEGSTHLVEWMPEGFLGIDDAANAKLVGVVDKDGVVWPFFPSGPIPLSELEDYGGANSFNDLVEDLRVAEEANGGNWSGGESPADYWNHRVNRCECDKDAFQAEKRCKDAIGAQAAAATLSNIGVTGIGVGAIGAAGGGLLMTGFPPAMAVGGVLLVGDAALLIDGINDHVAIQRAVQNAQNRFCNCAKHPHFFGPSISESNRWPMQR